MTLSRALEDRLAEIADRLQALEDEKAILSTLHRYAHCLDYGLEREWLDCFTDDAKFGSLQVTDAIAAEKSRAKVTPPPPGAAGALGMSPVERNGKAELAKWIATHTRPPERFHKHLVVDPRISAQGDAADVVSYFVTIFDFAHFGADLWQMGAYIRAFGRYHDKLVRCPDGKWRFRERMIELEAFLGP